ncbi:MAG: SIS domain-containing protein [Atopobium sp.]|uniref:SIS domain-containing protein n=1 Tax=Atopobium sp. TaxID=1872650 RepID=UPI002A74E1CB|nr:SIS domain-containing protein [Atopobium sp.]MDY2788867.1 SIS domain-containing protein [Atopobium sp.]
MQNQISELVAAILASKKESGGVSHIVWIGAGGSNGGNYAAQYFMEHEATELVSYSYTSNEFVHAIPKFVGPKTVVVAVSMRGTAETIEAARVARACGATTVAIYVDESALTDVCEYQIPYQSLAVDQTNQSRSNAAITLRLAIEFVQQTEGYKYYQDACAGFELVDPIYKKAFAYCQPLAQKWAQENVHRPTVNILANGPLMGAAYVFAICNVQEMLQMDAVTTNNCDFFHGPFEVVDKTSSIFLLMSSGRNRANDERALRFLNRFAGENTYVLDAKELGIYDIKDSVNEYFNHLIFSPILNNVYMRALSQTTNKDYTTRRYMWKEQY